MLTTGYGHIHFGTIDSTNAEALRRAAVGEAGPLWITAGLQQAGRGRQGRNWISEPGNFYGTLLTRLSVPIGEMGQVSFVTALAVADAIGALTGLALQLKWPNDVILENHKLAGILIEGAGGGRVAIGCGINLCHKPEASATRYPAVALTDHGFTITPQDMLSALATALAARLVHWQQDGFGPIREDWLKRAYGLGREITLEAAGRSLNGVFTGVAADGALLLTAADGALHHLHAGDVGFLREANGLN